MSIVSRPKPIVTTISSTNFSPKDINGCKLWLDAADVNSFTLSGNTLQSIQDKSAIGNSMTVVSAPTYNATGFNSKPCFVFAGGNSITCPLSGVTTQDIMMVAVWKQTQNSMSSPFSMGPAGSGSEIGLLWHSGEGRYLSYTYGAGDSHNSSVSYNVNVIQVGIKISSVMSCWINGTVGDTANSARGNTANTIYIGGGSWTIVGQLAEIIFYVGTVNNTQRQQVEGYLAQKWGLTSSLPAGHLGLTVTFYGAGTNRTIPIPRTIDGCVLWLDGADPAGNGTVPASGSALYTWVDKGGIANNLTGGGTLGTYNGLRIVNFSNSYFQNGSFTQSGPLTIIFIGKINAFDSNWQTFSDNVGGLRPYVGSEPGVELRSAFRYGGTLTTNVEIWTLIFSSSDNTVFNVNGADVRGNQTGYGGIGFTNGIRLGFAGNDTAFLNGWIGEYIIYNTGLGITQMQQVEGYLAQKWGITSSLPPGHPGLTQKLYSIVTTTVSIPVSISFTLVPYYLKYTPLNTNCILWLDASDPTTLFSDAAGTTLATAGGTVGYWKDKSSSGFNATQATLSYRPTYALNGRNGKSVLSFNELTNFLNLPQFTAVPLTIFFVAQSSTFLSNSYFLSLGAAGATLKLRALSSPASYGVDGITAISTTNSDTNWHLWTLTISSSTATFYFDGTLVGTSSWANGSSYTFATNTIASLNQQTAGQATTIIMPEILFYNSVLSTTDQQTVESYLASKWSLASQLSKSHLNFSKPAGLPYGNFQPSIVSVSKFITVVASGGRISYATVSGINYLIHTFTKVGTATFTLTSPASVAVTILVVAGGGGGGYDDGGGGGAGGVIYNSSFPITAGSYTITVGDGGGTGGNGGNSIASSLTAVGGGGGGSQYTQGASGGSGGGVSWGSDTPGSGTPGQGYNGGNGSGGPYYSVGGGGGAGGVGGTGVGAVPGNGGIGVSYTIAGTTYNVGGGGGAGLASQNSSGTHSTASYGGGNGAGHGTNAAVAGTPNTGGGGGGGNNEQAGSGAAGGSGIVVIAYSGIPRISFASSGLVITHQDGRPWKVSGDSIGLNTGTQMSLTIYAGGDVYNSENGRVGLFNNGNSTEAVRHAGYVMWAHTFSANNYDFAWYFVSSGSNYLIYNDYPSIGSAWQVSYDPTQDRVLIVPPGDAKYGMLWNITPRVTLSYVYSSYPT
jgi:hypothetical protein